MCKLNLAPTVMRGKADFQEVALIVMGEKPELAISGKTGDAISELALAPFGCEQVKIKHGETKTGQLVS